MNQIYRLFNCHQINNFNSRNDHQIKFDKPIRLSTYAVKLNGDQSRTLVDNPDKFHLKYSLDKFENLGLFDCLIKKEIKAEINDPLVTLKINGEIDAFLEHILANRKIFLNENKVLNKKDQDKSTDDKTDVSNQLAGLSLNESIDNRIIPFDFVGLRATLSTILNCQYSKDEF